MFIVLFVYSIISSINYGRRVVWVVKSPNYVMFK